MAMVSQPSDPSHSALGNRPDTLLSHYGNKWGNSNMTKVLYALLLTVLSLNTIGSPFDASSDRTTPLSASEAIQYSVEPSADGTQILFSMAEHVYLYRDKLKTYDADKNPIKAGQFLEEAEIIQDPAFGEMAVFFNSATYAIDASELPAGTSSIKVKYQGCDKAIGLCYPPTTIDVAINAKASDAKPALATTPAEAGDLELSNASGITSFLQNAGAIVVVATFLVLGIGLTFTPCVLPMVPILSSVIAGQKDLTTSKGFVMSTTYVLGMAITFALAGTVVGLMGARFNLQIYMQQPVVLGVFAGLFVLLAMAMFGFYELRLPRFIQDPLDRLNQKQEGGSWISVFVMGALSAVVVSPCVSAPLAGALVYISTTGDAVLGGFALFALGLGMGLPLIVIGTTGASMLPKAGMWMEQVKHFFGVLLLAVGLWILGRVLPESIYLAGWVALLAIYAVTLGAFETAETAKQRFMKGISLIMFAIAMILMVKIAFPGAGTSSNTTVMSNANGNPQATIASADTQGFFETMKDEAEFNQALAEARANEQLVFVDVYAEWCIECKIMAKTLFADGEVQASMEDFRRIKLDITEFNEFHKAYLESNGIFGPPALLFYGLDGAQIDEAKILGEISKPDFLNHLDQFDP